MAVTTHIELSSPAFKNGEAIPSKYTCDGVNVSPPLHTSAPPANAKSWALIVDDPDASEGRAWVHWLLYNLPPKDHRLRENISKDMDLPSEALEGLNDFRKTGYGGPCPPTGVHHYYFRLFALDRMLPLPEGATREELEQAMKGHILAQTELMGTYSRKSRP